MDADEIDAGRARWQARYDAARKRDADFTTLSGMPVEPVYGPPEGADVPGLRADRLAGRVSRSPAACIRPATAAGPGRSGSSPASATPSRPTSATR